MIAPRLVKFLSIALLSLTAPAVSAQNASPARVVEKIDESVLIPLKGNTLPVANSTTDVDRVRPDLALTDLVLVLSRGPEQQAAFDAFVASQYDASSPNYHHWLQPAEVGERFGPSIADIATVSNWLASRGLSVKEVSKDRMAIRFAGTAAQIESAFHTEIHNIQVNGEPHVSNMSDPQIPAALAPVVVGLKALNDFRPKPLHLLGSKAQYNSATGQWQRLTQTRLPNPTPTSDVTSNQASPDFGITVSTSSGSFPVEDVTPYDFATIYNVQPLWNSNIDGTGQTIAIVATSDVNPADIASYRSLFGLPAGPALQQIKGANGLDPGLCNSSSQHCGLGDLYENTLDTELSGAVAKGAQIVVVSSGVTSPTDDPVYDSSSYIVQNDTAKIISVSYGLCELFMGTSGNTAYNNLWETAATEGIGVSVASGDSGSPACDQGMATSVPYGAQFGLAVSGMASTPYDTAVGGTDFAWCKPKINSSGNVVGCSTVAPYWNTSNNPANGASAARYVPEIPWNDSCASPQAAAYLESVASFVGDAPGSDPESACNFVTNNYSYINARYGVDLSGWVDSVGGGGGASNCTVNGTTSTTTTPAPSTCSGGYAKPSWQSGVTGIPSDGRRDVPDVSFFAGNGLWSSATLVCVSEAGSCVNSTNPTTQPTAQEVGGTSVAAPEMAGVMALINQRAGAPQGNPNAGLYLLAGKQNYSYCSAESASSNNNCYFNDVDASTIAMPCTSGALNCTVTHSGDFWGILSGFNATTGFDNAAGLGSLNVANVVNNWTSTGGSATATVTVTPSQNTISIDQSLTVAVSVSGSSGTPTGNIGLVSGGYTGTAGALSSGSYTFTIPGYSLAAGTNILSISYGGDSTYANTSATTNITVNKVAPTVTVSASPSTIGANATISVGITVSGTGPTPSGTVQLSGGGYTGSCTLTKSACTLTLSSNTLTSGTDTLAASYGGDKVYAATTGTATITVTSLKPTVVVAPLSSTVDTTSPLSVAVTITGTGSTPTGTVSLFGLLGSTPGNGYALGGTLSGGSYTFSIPALNLYGGTDTLYAAYQGDSVYVPTNGTAMVTVTKPPTSITALPSATSIYTNAPLTISGTLTGVTSWEFGYESANVSGAGFSGGGLIINNQYSVKIPPGGLSVGNDTLEITYPGDKFFAASSTTTTVSVAQWVKVAPSITVTPASSSVYTGQSVNVAVTITGSDGTPTGTVTLSAGAFTSWAQPLSNGAATFIIPMNTFAVGTGTFNVSYSGDATYLPSTQSGSVTVTASGYTLSATTPAPISPGQSATSTVSVASTQYYSNEVSLTCALTSGPANQTGDAPTCAVPGGFVFVGGSQPINVATVAATSGAVVRPESLDKHRGFAAGATVFAMLLLFGIPARRRRWHSILGLLLLLFAFGTLGACGGGGAGGSGGGSGGGAASNPGTAAGAYIFTVTGTGNDSAKTSATTTFTVSVN